MSTNHVSVRLDAETIARIDALAPQFSTEHRLATRSDVLRALILTALAGHPAADPTGDAPPRPASPRLDRTDGRLAGRRRAGKSEREPR